MNKGTRWVYLGTGVAAALAVAVVSAFAFTSADASTGSRGTNAAEAGQAIGTIAGATLADGLPSAWTRAGDLPSGDYEEALATALGISLDDLQAAYQEARANAIQKAVDDGLFTQEQADRLPAANQPEAHAGFGLRGPEPGLQTFLAAALGISESELEAAQHQALESVLDQRIQDGQITQEAADLILAEDAAQSYVRSAMQTAYEDGLKQAVAAGAITQDQADLLLSKRAPNLGGPPDLFGGHPPFGPEGTHGPGGAAPSGN
jgi:hypothetical protein